MADVCWVGPAAPSARPAPPCDTRKVVPSKAFPCADGDTRVALSDSLRRGGTSAVTQRRGRKVTTETNAVDSSSSADRSIRDWADLAEEMWSYLTGKGAAINYNFIDMTIEVPRDIGPDAPRATWKLNGSLRVTTSDKDAMGSDENRA